MEAIVVFLERWYLRKQVNSWMWLEVRSTPPPKKWLFNAENDDLLLFVGEVPCFKQNYIVGLTEKQETWLPFENRVFT